MADHEGQPRPTPLDLTTQLAPTGRHYDDTLGVRWRVREMQRRNRPPALYFESDAAFRRVTDYPRNWEALTGIELELLSHGR